MFALYLLLSGDFVLGFYFCFCFLGFGAVLFVAVICVLFFCFFPVRFSVACLLFVSLVHVFFCSACFRLAFLHVCVVCVCVFFFLFACLLVRFVLPALAIHACLKLSRIQKRVRYCDDDNDSDDAPAREGCDKIVDVRVTLVERQRRPRLSTPIA